MSQKSKRSRKEAKDSPPPLLTFCGDPSIFISHIADPPSFPPSNEWLVTHFLVTTSYILSQCKHILSLLPREVKGVLIPMYTDINRNLQCAQFEKRKGNFTIPIKFPKSGGGYDRGEACCCFLLCGGYFDSKLSPGIIHLLMLSFGEILNLIIFPISDEKNSQNGSLLLRLGQLLSSFSNLISNALKIEEKAEEVFKRREFCKAHLREMKTRVSDLHKRCILSFSTLFDKIANQDTVLSHTPPWLPILIGVLSTEASYWRRSYFQPVNELYHS